MGAALVSFIGYGIAVALTLFGGVGIHAAARRWGDDDVSNREYLSYGASFVLLGFGVAAFTYRMLLVS